VPISIDNDDELRQFILKELRGSPHARLIRQLQAAPTGGGAQTAWWRWDPSTVGSVASGKIGLNASTWATATQLRISETTDPGTDVSGGLGSVTAGQTITLQQQDDSTRWGKYTVTAAPTDQGTYRTIPVSYVDAGAPPSNNNVPMMVSFSSAAGGGGGGDKNYVHTQGSAASVWSVTHSLGKYPTVEIVDSGNNALLTDIHYIDVNSLTVSFAGPASGKAYCN
jgi:hypothetical protein